MRFGRMQKRFEANRYELLVDLVLKMTGKALTDQERKLLTFGADEVDLVRSGLEETMINAYRGIRETWVSKPEIKDLRTAAMVYAIEKIASDYLSLGIWP